MEFLEARFYRLKLFFSTIAASEYSLNSFKAFSSILNILNVRYKDEITVLKTKHRTRMLHDVVRAREPSSPARRCARDLTLRETAPRNIPLAMTMKTDGHCSMSMELRKLAFGLRNLR